MFSKAIVLLASLIYVCQSGSPSVNDLSVRLSSPGNDASKYRSSHPDNYNSGTISVNIDDIVHFVMWFDNADKLKYKLTVTGNNGGSIFNSAEITHSGVSYGRNLGKDFENSDSMTVKCKIVDDSGKTLSSKTITIGLDITDLPAKVIDEDTDIVITDLSARIGQPSKSIEDYREKNNAGDGKTLTIVDKNEFVWFLALFNDYDPSYKVVFSGDGNNGGSFTSSGSSMNIGNAYATTMTSFDKSSNFDLKCEVFDAQNNLVASREVTINLVFSSRRRRLIDMHNKDKKRRMMSPLIMSPETTLLPTPIVVCVPDISLHRDDDESHNLKDIEEECNNRPIDECEKDNKCIQLDLMF